MVSCLLATSYGKLNFDFASVPVSHNPFDKIARELMKILETMPKAESRVRGRISKYLWDEWLDGKIRFAELGIDFFVTIEAFVVTLRYAARSRLMSLEYRMTYTGVAFCAEKLPGA